VVNAQRLPRARLVALQVLLAQGAGARRLLLEVASGDAAARALYAGAGFVEVGRRTRYYPRGAVAEDALVLALRLSS